MNEFERKLQGTTSDDVTVPINTKQPILPPDFLSRFEIINLSLVCEAISPINLPIFAGSAFRGIFGRALKDLACVARNTPCSECPLKERCAYPGVFEIQADPSLPIYQKVSDPPRPFVLEPPTDSKIAPGQTFEVRLYLFGNAIAHYPWVIQAFARAGSRGVGFGRGKYKVKRALEFPSQRVLVEDDRILGKPKIFKADQLSQNRAQNMLTLHFETPVRIKFKGQLANKLEFSTIVRQLLRRIAQIGAFHCGVMLETDFRQWIHLAESINCTDEQLRWFDWVRYSSRQKNKMRLGGLVGQVSYEGNIGPFYPLLALGQLTHVGKGTTFGLGKYRLTENTK